MPIPNLTSRTSCGVFYWTFQKYMSKRAEKARLACASVIKLCWPLSFALTLLFCAVLLVLFTNSAKPYSGKQTVRSSRQSAKEDSFCQVHLSASLRSFFQMWAVAVRFLKAKRSAPRTSSLGKRHAVPASDLPTRHATTALTPLPALRDLVVHSHEWKRTFYSCQMTPRSACSRWNVSRRRSPTPSPTWTPGASLFSARTTSLRTTFVISLQGVRFCRTKLVISTTGRTTSMTYVRVQTTRWTN